MTPQEFSLLNQQMSSDLGAWQEARRKTKGGYQARYELGQSIHISKEGKFMGVWK